MKLIPTKNYKKLYKKLNKETASISLPNKIKNNNYYDCLDFEHVEITNESVISTTNFNLPNDIINNILEFIPINTRLSILKKMYNTKFLKNKLKKINIKNLYKCALLAKKIYHDSYYHYFSNYKNCNVGWIQDNLSKKEITKYSNYYKEEFMKVILLAIKKHSKIYKKIKISRLVRISIDEHGMYIYTIQPSIEKTNLYGQYKDIPKFEKLLFKMYSQIILI
jgi:hypothetical protein